MCAFGRPSFGRPARSLSSFLTPPPSFHFLKEDMIGGGWEALLLDYHVTTCERMARMGETGEARSRTER